MLRLWPETVRIGLFDQHSWVTRGGPTTPVDSVAGQGGDAYLDTLASVLNNSSRPIAKGSKLALTVSDTLALVHAIPWQGELSGPDELERYARACMINSGIDIGGEWELQTDFPNYAGMGLAVALKCDWMLKLVALCEAHDMKLLSVLPVSSRAFAHRRSKRRSDDMQILMESKRCTALTYGSKGLVACDVEPIAGKPDMALQRLIRRTHATRPAVPRIGLWSEDAGENMRLQEVIRTEIPGAVPAPLAAGWRR